ncbi:MAG: hypothetical protein JXQ75_01115 [Phycisphaerae bacterium]|nr:hypothetical protein [Phycisphaerae bacterium]
MMPCKFCTESLTSRGLKQVGKTRTAGTHFARRYQCQDCDAAMVLSGDLRNLDSIKERWFAPGTFHLSAPKRSRVERGPSPRRQEGLGNPFHRSGVSSRNARDADGLMRGFSSIRHYRLDSGWAFQNLRREIPDGHIEILTPMLTPGIHQVPNTPAWLVQTSIAKTTLIATFHGSDAPLFRMWVVLDGRDLPLVVSPPRNLDIPLPACILETLKEQPFDPVVGWLRDLELTLAWAWVQQNNCPGSAPSVPDPRLRGILLG